MPDIVSGGLAAIIVSVIAAIIQLGLFVRPEQLEKKHREILEDAEKKFASLSALNDLKADFSDIRCKVYQIYELLLKKKGE